MNLIMRRNSMADSYQPPVCNNTAYAMLVPKSGDYNGKLYSLNLRTTQLTAIQRYTNYYYTAMENVNGVFYVYCNDLVRGFGTMNPETGVYTKLKKVNKGMTDMTYNHNNGKMYGLRYGDIWEINLADGSVVGTSPVCSGGEYIAIACSTGGDMYAIRQNASPPTGLFRYRGCDFTRQPELVGKLGHAPQYTQSMAFVPGTMILYWCSVNAQDRDLVCMDLTDLQNPVMVSVISMTEHLGGLVIL